MREGKWRSFSERPKGGDSLIVFAESADRERCWHYMAEWDDKSDMLVEHMTVAEIGGIPVCWRYADYPSYEFTTACRRHAPATKPG